MQSDARPGGGTVRLLVAVEKLSRGTISVLSKMPHVKCRNLFLCVRKKTKKKLKTLKENRARPIYCVVHYRRYQVFTVVYEGDWVQESPELQVPSMEFKCKV